MKRYILFSLLGLLAFSTVAIAATARYTTKSGDTWESVAAKYGITVQQLADLNQPARGTRLNVPAVTPPPPQTCPDGQVGTPPNCTTPPPPPSGNEVSFNAYLTGYTYWDNTPPGSADISNPIIHQKAGGTGTYADPITIAVGHSMATGQDVLDYPAGTIFYVAGLKRYFIVEDTCGDGAHPENGPCHKNTDEPGVVWLDMWIGGSSGTRSSTNKCAENLTHDYTVIMNPASSYPVTPGAIFESGCK